MKKYPSTLYIALVVLAFFSCGEQQLKKIQHGPLLPGDYAVHFSNDTLSIPAQLRVNEMGDWSFINWTEQIDIDSIQWQGNAFKAKMPLYNSSIEGTVINDSTVQGRWTDHTREPLYQVEFMAKRAAMPTIPKNLNPEKLVYSVLFSPEHPSNSDRAIGMFQRYDTLLYGTFLTGSGDHRFLQGRYQGDSISLSCFDGTHLFYYKAKVSGDSLIGNFYSGVHHSQPWVGALNANAKLSHPDSITRVKDPNEEFRFVVRNGNGDSVLFDRSKFKDKVSIVQVFGSWCPNCTDESVFFKKLYGNYHHNGLEIIPVAFERSEDIAVAKAHVETQFKELGLAYTPYFGEKIGKGAASRVFTGLSDMSAFPTSIFIDKMGNVRKVHTGFYGPGTHEFYTIHTAELEDFVKQLLQE